VDFRVSCGEYRRYSLCSEYRFIRNFCFERNYGHSAEYGGRSGSDYDVAGHNWQRRHLPDQQPD
jgi:hypothetical protein